MSDDASMGPISYLVVEYPRNTMTGDGLRILLDLVDRGLVRVLDFRFVTRSDDGAIRALEISDLDSDDLATLSLFEGASSGLIDESDLGEAAGVIEPGSSAGILVFENRWAAAFTGALRRGGAEVVAAGYIPLDEVAGALDATETAQA